MGAYEIVRMKGRQTILGVCCTRCMLHSADAALSVGCTQRMLHSVLTHDDAMER